jgi:FKBP-type peptidyl-prolyl cis-trans isomerase
MMISAFLRVQFLLIIGSLWIATSAGSNEEGETFLAENKSKEGVVTLLSGMQYKVLKKGSGIFHPGPSTPCSVHYTGSLIDGTVFDSSKAKPTTSVMASTSNGKIIDVTAKTGKPATFAPNQVIKGWTEAYVCTL